MIALATILLFFLEDTLVPILFPVDFHTQYIINPHLTLIAIVMISLYLGSKIGLIYGLIFGALFDLTAGTVMGLFLFAYGLIGNLLGLLLHLLHRNIWLILTSVGISSLFLDAIHFGFFRLFNYTSQGWSYVLFREMIPNSVFNIILALMLYPIFHKLLNPIRLEFEKKEGRS